MNYTPTRNIKREPIAKESVIDKNKGTVAGFIGYWLYRLTSLFKRYKPKSNGEFLLLCSKIPLKQKKHYRNKQGVECVEFYINAHDWKLIAGIEKGYLLLRLHNNKHAIDKSMLLNVSTKGIQETLGVINSMQISLNDKIKKAV